MKKRLLSILLAFATVMALVLSAAGCELEEPSFIDGGSETDTGRVLIIGKTYVIVYDDGDFLVMNNVSEDKGLFDDLSDGDLIEIKRKPEIAESYPAQCYVKKCKKLEDGSFSDISPKAVNALFEMGWFDKDPYAIETDAATEIETEAHKAEPSFTDKNLTVEDLATLISKTTDLHFDFLYEMTAEELERERYRVEPGFGCYDIVIEEEVNVGTAATPSKVMTAEFRYTFSAYPDESDGGSYLTHFYTNSPNFNICGINTGALYNIIASHFRDKGFEVDTTNGRVVSASRCGIVITVVITESCELRTDIHIPVTNREGIIY